MYHAQRRKCCGEISLFYFLLFGTVFFLRVTAEGVIVPVPW